MTDLDKLIKAVEAGEGWDTISGSLAASVIGLDNIKHFAAAISGSLDATHALHKAVLPGWRVFDLCEERNGKWSVCLEERTTDRMVEPTADTPARAWLLAILKAMKERGDE